MPRTGTTSLSIGLTKMGFKTCHCVFNDKLYDKADAFADTPIFADYKELSLRFPDAKFIYTERPANTWIKSFMRVYPYFAMDLQLEDTAERIITKKAYEKVFGAIHFNKHLLIDQFLAHQSEVREYFEGSKQLLPISINDPLAFNKVNGFLELDDLNGSFPQVNAGMQVKGWDEWNHPNKMPSL